MTSIGFNIEKRIWCPQQQNILTDNIQNEISHFMRLCCCYGNNYVVVKYTESESKVIADNVNAVKLCVCVCVCVCVFGFNVAFNNFSVITTVSGCDRALSAHFYSAASLKYHVPDTWHDTTPSHIILTLGRPVLALPRKSECQARSS